ncbi:MAG: CoA pyrophosphatase [Alphaproteobacteria bacterium]|nr:CoA pyrophosphatase [Alphaproteobacteria bacterium]
MRFDNDLRETIRARLAGFERKRRDDTASLKQAAVAICVALRQDPADDWGGPDDAAFLLTRRAPKLRAHSGQLALPGGRVDPGETIEQTALRELDEELGVSLGGDAVLGHLDPYPTRSGYLISPIVVWTPRDTVVRPNPAEVDRLYRIPLSELRRPDSPEIFNIPESDRPVIRLPIPLMNTEINAPTAAMLYQFREVALEDRATRVDHFDQPVFAWR